MESNSDKLLTLSIEQVFPHHSAEVLQLFKQTFTPAQLADFYQVDKVVLIQCLTDFFKSEPEGTKLASKIRVYYAKNKRELAAKPPDLQQFQPEYIGKDESIVETSYPLLEQPTVLGLSFSEMVIIDAMEEKKVLSEDEIKQKKMQDLKDRMKEKNQIKQMNEKKLLDEQKLEKERIQAQKIQLVTSQPKQQQQMKLTQKTPGPGSTGYKSSGQMQNPTNEILDQLSNADEIDQNEILDTYKKTDNTLYQELCSQTKIYDSDMKLPMNKLTRAIASKQWDDLNKFIQTNLYEKDPHLAMCFYYQKCTQYPEVKNPEAGQSKKIESLERLRQLPRPGSIETQLFTALKHIEQNQNQEAEAYFKEIIQKEHQYFETNKKIFFDVLPQIRSHYNSINRIRNFETIKLDIQGLSSSFNLATMLEQLINGEESHILEAANIFKKIYNEQFAFKLYFKILEIEPNFEKYIPKDVIYFATAPTESIKQKAKELAELYKETNSQMSQPIRKANIEQLSQQIYNENSNYFHLLSEYLEQFKVLTKKYAMPQSQKEISIDNLYFLSKYLIPLEQKKTNVDFMSIDLDFTFEGSEKNIKKQFEETDTINMEELVSLLFNYIKIKQNFASFINLMSTDPKKIFFNHQTLINYLLKNADTNLKTLLFMAITQYMPVPFLTIDWEKEMKEKPSYMAQEELFYSFEKYKAVLTFKISANQNNSPQGCSAFVNQVLMKDFETHSSHQNNFGTIDIQFDYNFAGPLCVPVADVQGCIDLRQLKSSYSLFNIFVIHHHSNPEDLALLNQEIKSIKSVNSSAFIICIQHTQDQCIEDEFKEFDQNKKICFYKTQAINKLQQQDFKNLVKDVQQLILTELDGHIDFMLDPDARLDSIEQYNVFLNKNSCPTSSIESASDIIKHFFKIIKFNVEDLKSIQFLPMNYLFTDHCIINTEISQDSEQSTATLDLKRRELSTISEKMSNYSENNIIKLLLSMFDYQTNFLGIITIVAKVLKGLLESKVKPLLLLRNDLKLQASKSGVLEESKALTLEIKNLTSLIENKWFSSEFIVRELYLLSRFGKNTEKNQQDYIELSRQQINLGQPFELIDGNNLAFISNIYDQIYQHEEDKVLVVSVIGPQSSGKSLLLNFLFGAQFQSAVGRCTKGIYGTIIELKGKASLYQKILILDTEGIQAAEGRDEKFDRRIVFYILCVSHIVLICNKGEMNKQMAEVIKLAVSAITNLKQSIMSQPDVNIVMNMVASKNEATLQQSVQRVSDEILEIGSHDKNSRIFTISTENLFMLSYAFNRSGEGQMIVNQPSSEFAKDLQRLSDKIKNVLRTKEPVCNIEYWFKFANDFWNFTATAKAITEYKNLDEKQKDQKLLEKIAKIIDEYFTNQTERHDKIVEDIVQKILKQNSGSGSTKVQILTDNAKNELDNVFTSIQMQVNEAYKTFCGVTEIGSTLANRREGQLLIQMKAYLQDWISAANKKIALFSHDKSKVIVDSRLQEYIEQLLQKQESYSAPEAEAEFVIAWNKVEVEIKIFKKEKKQVYTDVFSNINFLYKHQIIDNAITNFENEHFLIKEFKKKPDCMLKYLTKSEYTSASDFFFFIGDIIPPSGQKLVDFQKKKRQYLTDLPPIFTEMIQVHAYDWISLLQERFNLKKLAQEIIKSFHKDFKRMGLSKSFKIKVNQGNINIIVQRLEQECSIFDINPKGLCYRLNNIYSSIVTYKNNQQKETWTNDELINAVSQFMEDIYSSIEMFFDYNKSVNRSDSKVNFYYFEINHIIQHKGNFIQSILKKENYVNRFKNQLPPDSQYKIIGKSVTIIMDREKLKNTGATQYIETYFKYLADPHAVKMPVKCMESEEMKGFLFSFIDWKKVIEKIDRNLIMKYKRDGVFNEQIGSTFEWIKHLKKYNKSTNKEIFCNVTRDLIQSIVYDVKEVINQIDEELEPFCFKLSSNGDQALHSVAQTLLISLSYQLQKVDENYILELLQNKKDNQQKMFIAKLMKSSIGEDNAFAVQLSQSVFDFIKRQEENRAIQDFTLTVDSLKANYNRNLITQGIEEFIILASGNEEKKSQPVDELLELEEVDVDHSSEEESFEEFMKHPKTSIIGASKTRGAAQMLQNKPSGKLIRASKGYSKEKAVNYYVDPKQFLKNEFSQKWAENADNKLIEVKQVYMRNIQDQIVRVTTYYDKLGKKLQEFNQDKDGVNLFKIIMKQAQNMMDQDSGDLSYDQKKQITAKAICQYLISLLQPLLQPSWINDQVFTINAYKVCLQSELIKLPTSDDIIFTIDSQLSDLICFELKDAKITSLSNFIIAFIKNIKELTKKLEEINNDKLLLNSRSECETVFQGCPNYCPLCRKQCDILPSVLHMKHKCNEGHQIQGFGGNRTFGTDFAVTQGCDNLVDEDTIFYKNQDLKWSEFKGKFEEWDFTSSNNMKNQSKEKNNMIWNFLGQDICHKYNGNPHNIPIKYVPANQLRYQRTHYILMLDRSGSMAGARWDNVIKATTNLLNELSSTRQIKAHSKISIIGYSGASQKIIYKRTPNAKTMINKIQFSSGNTDFDPSLRQACHWMEKSYREFDKFVVCLLSDGEAPFPKDALQLIKDNKALTDKLNFTCIAFGSDEAAAKILTPIAKELNGKMVTVINPEKLSQAFIKLIPNHYNV